MHIFYKDNPTRKGVPLFSNRARGTTIQQWEVGDGTYLSTSMCSNSNSKKHLSNTQVLPSANRMVGLTSYLHASYFYCHIKINCTLFFPFTGRQGGCLELQIFQAPLYNLKSPAMTFRVPVMNCSGPNCKIKEQVASLPHLHLLPIHIFISVLSTYM